MLKSRLLGAVGIVAVVGGVLMAQTPASPAFEVASVKPNVVDRMPSLGALPGGHVTGVNQSLLDLITFAYSLEDYQIAQGPDWINSSRYNIEATIGSSHLDASGHVTTSDFKGMLRTLLMDRFKLAAHTERRELPVFALSMARSDRRLGTQLRTSGADCAPLTPPQGRSLPPPPPPPPPRPDSSAPPAPPRDFADPHGPTRCGALFLRGYITARAMTMGQLAVALSGAIHQPVVRSNHARRLLRFRYRLHTRNPSGKPRPECPLNLHGRSGTARVETGIDESAG